MFPNETLYHLARIKLCLHDFSYFGLFNHRCVGRAQLLLVKLLPFCQRWARLSNSERDSCRLHAWGYMRFGCQNIETFISSVGSTKTSEFPFYKETSFFNFNNFSIIDYSQVRGFQDENIIRRPDQFQDNLWALSGKNFSFICSQLNGLSINNDFIFLILNSVRCGRLQFNFSFINVQFYFFLFFDFLSKDSKGVWLFTFCNKNMVTSIKFIGIGAVIKRSYNIISNSANRIKRSSSD